MSDEQSLLERVVRASRVCPACGAPKECGSQDGLVGGMLVCWSCWKHESPADGVEPLKYSGLEFPVWIKTVLDAKRAVPKGGYYRGWSEI